MTRLRPRPLARFAAAAAAALIALAPPGAPAQTADAPQVCAGDDLSHIAGLAAAEARHADDLVNRDGVLWRIDKPGVAPSFLYGTIHSTDDSAIAMARRAAREIEGAKVLATELGGPFDAMDKASLAAALFSRAAARDVDTFAGVVAPADVKPIEDFLAARSLPPELAHHLQLWFLAVMASLPSCEMARQALDLPEVDQLLAEIARDKGVKVIGLEKVEEQVDVMAAMRPALSATILAASVRNPKLNDDVYVTMLSLYRAGRPAEILAIVDALQGLSEAERAAEREFTAALLVERNGAMAERAAPLLNGGGAVIAVGALHLSGKHGLVERFRAAGYRVERVW